MKYFRYFLLASCIPIVICSCRKDALNPSWDVDLLAPLANTSLSIQDIINDTLIGVKPDSLVYLVYENAIYGITLDSMIDVPDNEYSYNAKLETITLTDMTFTEVVSLGEMCNQLMASGNAQDSSIGKYIIDNNGGTIPLLPEVSVDQPVNVDVDAGKYFKTMTLTAGWMDITIHNGLPVDLKNIELKLRNKSETEPFATIFFDLIPKNNTVKDSVDLAGKTVEGEMIGTISSFTLASAFAVPVDTTDAITTTFIVRDLVPYSATAVFPAQNLIDHGDITKFNFGGVELNEFEVLEGSLRLEAFNTIEDTLFFLYCLKSATLNGVPFVYSGMIPPAENGVATSITKICDMKGYTLDLRGIGTIEKRENKDLNGNGFYDPDTVNTFYHTVVGRIDSSGKIISLSLQDSIYILAKIYSIIPNYAVGFMGHDTIEFNSTEEFDAFKKVKDGQITLDDLIVSFSVSNQFGAETGVKVNEITSINTAKNQEVTLNSAKLNDVIIMNKPVDPHSYTVDVVPTVQNILLDKTNSNSKALIEILPDKFRYSLYFLMNPTTPSPPIATGTDFIYHGDQLKASLNIEMPLNLIASNLTLEDTTDFELGASSIENINGGNLFLYITNEFPFEAKIQLYLLDQNSWQFDSLLADQAMIQAGNYNILTGRVTSPVTTKITIPASKSVLNKLVGTKFIRITVVFNTRSLNAPEKTVKIFSDYSMDVKIVGDFNYLIH